MDPAYQEYLYVYMPQAEEYEYWKVTSTSKNELWKKAHFVARIQDRKDITVLKKSRYIYLFSKDTKSFKLTQTVYNGIGAPDKYYTNIITFQSIFAHELPATHLTILNSLAD